MRRGNKEKFGRPRKQRHALAKGLATALITHERITTTAAKAKLLTVTMGYLVTTAKKNTLASRRDIAAVLGPQATVKLVKNLAPKLSTRNGGYTRTTSLGRRRSDGAPMSLVELLSN